jgi:hypothetical protein
MGPTYAMNNGPQRIAAKRIGCTVEEYTEKRSQGLRYCTVHKGWVPKIEAAPKGMLCGKCLKLKNQKPKTAKVLASRKASKNRWTV